MHRIERGFDRQIGDQPFDLTPACEVDVIAERAILLGTGGSREPGLVTVLADLAVGIVDRTAVRQKWRWQLKGVPVHGDHPSVTA